MVITLFTLCDIRVHSMRGPELIDEACVLVTGFVAHTEYSVKRFSERNQGKVKGCLS